MLRLMKIPNNPRYNYVMQKAYAFIIENGITSFPVNPHKIIKTNRWGIETYSNLAIKFECSHSKIASNFKSTDGITIYDGSNYTIAYNDKVQYPKRIPFTLMHEIGHIYLGHLKDFETVNMRQSELTKDEYKVLEDEANSFARNILSPAPIYNALKYKGLKTVSAMFGITHSAGKTRSNLLPSDIDIVKEVNLFDDFLNRFSEFMHSRYCCKCKNYFYIPNSSYCPICGNSNLIWKKGEEILIYNSNKLKKCLICENEEIDDNANFCKICGTSMDEQPNRCDFFLCDAILDNNARYCPYCGKKSIYYENNCLDSYELEKGIKQLEREHKKLTNN